MTLFQSNIKNIAKMALKSASRCSGTVFSLYKPFIKPKKTFNYDLDNH